MEAPVKSPLGRRDRKALETRRRILDAAEDLFTSNGYASTTMTAIAEQADVAVQTLYAVFGNKRAILTELIDARVVGDDHAGSLPDRQDWRAMEREPDPHRQLALFAQIATRIGNRSARSTRSWLGPPALTPRSPPSTSSNGKRATETSGGSRAP